MSTERSDVGARMLKTRQPTGATQSKAAALLGISFGAYKNYEVGKRELPSSIAVKFSSVFDVSLVWLLTGEGSPHKLDHDELVEEASRACYDIAIQSPERYSSNRFGYFCRFVFRQVISKNSDVESEAASVDKLLS